MNKAKRKRALINYRVYLEAASHLALKHFNDRDPTVLPHLPELLQNCDVQMTMEMHDTKFSPIEAARQLQDILIASNNNSLDAPRPFALLGAARSAVSQTVAVLAGCYELPQVSATSTSASLDNKASYPYFARTVPNNAGDAKALVLYLEKLQVTHFGVVFIRDSYGSAYHNYLKEEAHFKGITVVSAAFNDDDDDGSIPYAIEQLQKSGVKYFFGIFNPRSWTTVVRSAIKAGIIGQPGYTWFLSDTSLAFTQPEFTLDRALDEDVAKAIHGTGVIFLNVPTNLAFDDALSKFQNNTALQHELVSEHQDDYLFDDFDWNYPGSSLYQYLHYDAVISLGVAACRSEKDFFTGPEFYQTLVNLEFEGVSGRVTFKNETGTRSAEDLSYRIDNILSSDSLSTPDTIGFTSNPAVDIGLQSKIAITELIPFVYTDNATIPPMALPPFDEELNLITLPIRVLGLSLCAITILCSLGWGIWTWYYRNTDVVRMSQPIFLGQLCIGTIILATCIIPMAMQEPLSQRGLDMACMAVPWLLSIGFATTFAALFTKTRRLNLLFRHGHAMRRAKVTAKDVILPFAIMMTINVILLSIWTIVAPLTHSRVQVENMDSFGRYVESYGTCSGPTGKVEGTCFTIALVVISSVNVAVLLFANYQCYLARNLPSDFNESFYVAVTNAGILEALILGGPILLLVRDSPSANFLVRSLLVTIICFLVMLPIFIPIALQRGVRELRRRHSMGRPHISMVPSRNPTIAMPRQAIVTHNSVVDCPGTSMIVRNDDFWVHARSTAERGGGPNMNN